MEENVKVEEKKVKKKLPLIMMLCATIMLCAVFAVLCLVGVLPIPTDSGVVSIDKAFLLKEASNVQDEETLRELLLADEDLEIVVTKDITIQDTFIVHGTKTLKGDAKITGDFYGLFAEKSIFEVERDSHLIMDGLVIDGLAMGDGITVKQNGELTYLSGKMQYVRYGIVTNGKVTIEDIYLGQATLAGVYASFKSEVYIQNGTFYDAYDNFLYIETGGYMEIYEGVLAKKCVGHGVYNGGTLRIYGGEICETGGHAIVNEGDLITEYKGSESDGHIYLHDLKKRAINVDSASDTVIKDVYVENIRSNVIYVTDKVTQGKVTISDCVFDTTGMNDGNAMSLYSEVKLSNIVLRNTHNGSIFVRETAEVTADNITIENGKGNAMSVAGNLIGSNITIKNNNGNGIEVNGTFTGEDITIDGTANHAIVVGIAGGSDEKKGYAELTNVTVSNCERNNVVIRKGGDATIIDSVLNKSKRTNVSMQEDSDIVLDGVQVLGAKDENISAIGIQKNSNVTIKGDSLITGSTVYAISVSENAVLTMENGTIRDVNSKASGVAVRLNGKGATFNMKGGKICNNTSSEAAGAVYVGYQTIFNMYDGTITNNLTQKSGGGVYVLGTMNMYGGKIENNESKTNGGGINVACDTAKKVYGTLNMTGGTIQNNVSHAYGGGVCVNEGTVVKISGGTIKGNQADTSGNGILVNGDLTLSDNAYVKNNEVVLNSQKIALNIKGSSLSKHSASDPLYVIPNRETTNGVVVVNCDSENAVASLLSCVKSGTIAYTLTQLKNTMTVNIGKADMNMNGADKVYVSNFKQLKEAVETTTSKRYVIITADIPMESVVTVPLGTTVYIKDDGTTRTLTRADKLTSNFFRTYYGTGLYIAGTSYGSLVLDGQATDAEANEPLLRVRGTTEIRNVAFENNYTVGKGAFIRHHYGALSVYTSSFENGKAEGAAGAVNLIAGTAQFEDCTFEKNTSKASGGAIMVEDKSDVVLSLKSCDFNYNQAGTTAGAINAASGELHVTDSFFTNNVANGDKGGAVAVTKCKAVFDGHGSFTSNYAAAEGGAIHNNNSVLTITGYDFIDNSAKSGGAINVGNGTLYTDANQITDCAFFANEAYGVPVDGSDGAGKGGAIFNLGRTTNITDSVFGAEGNGNVSESTGGAIYVGNAGTIALTGNGAGKASFAHNTSSDNGGAICIGNGILNINGYSFDSNSAKHGGAIHINDNGKSAACIENTIFVRNTATTGNGGAVKNNISGQTENKFIFKGCTFGLSEETANTSKEAGGALWFNVGVQAEISDSTFNNNKSTGASGGAIYNRGVLTLTNTSLTANSTNTNGGAINNDGGTLNATDSSFVTNTAKQGGAIYNGNGATTTLTCENNKDLAVIRGNSATASGGAIQVGSGSLTVTGYSFESNEAKGASGGAILNGSILTLTKTSFTGNKAKTSGGAINNTGEAATLTADGCSFKGNISNNTNEGGGALSVTGKATAVLTNTSGAGSFASNYAANVGGAIYTNNAYLSVKGYTFDGNGKNANGDTVTKNGGAVYINSASPAADAPAVAFEEVSFKNNTSSGNGGAICNAKAANNGTGRAVTFTGCTFESNVSTAGQGGAIRSERGCSISIEDSAFNSNRSTKNNGGAIAGGGTFTIKNSSFTGNVADGADTANVYGGAIANNDTANTTIEGCTFEKNIASTTKHSGGGAIFSQGVLTIKDYVTEISGQTTTISSNFANNKSDDEGGAIRYTANKKTLTISGATKFVGNSTTFGGAIYTGSNGNIINITGAEFSQNSATGGGALCVNHASVVVTATDCVFGNNTAKEHGGAIYMLNGTLKLLSTTADFADSKFEGNQSGTAKSGDGKGGAVYVTKGTFYVGHDGNDATTEYGYAFNSNKSNYHGGAMNLDDNAVTIINSSEFKDNTGNNGGAINVYSNNFTVRNTLFAENIANSAGGALMLNHAESAGITSCTFRGNESLAGGQSGGAIAIENKVSDVTITSSTFEDNEAKNTSRGGGAIYVNQGTLTVQSSSFARNLIKDGALGGGAIYIHNNGAATVNVRGNTTFTNNDLPDIYKYETGSVKHAVTVDAGISYTKNW